MTYSNAFILSEDFLDKKNLNFLSRDFEVVTRSGVVNALSQKKRSSVVFEYVASAEKELSSIVKTVIASSSVIKKCPMLLITRNRPDWLLDQYNHVKTYFDPILVFAVDQVLPISEIAEIFKSENSGHYAIGGDINEKLATLTVVRGDLSTILVPLKIFRPSASTKPDFRKFSIQDFGQTLKFGSYEASFDSVLYELDIKYRNETKRTWAQEDRSFGACLRRLRLQRGITQSDFKGIDQKEIGRLERGEVKNPRKKTVDILVKTLEVKDQAEILTY